MHRQLDAAKLSDEQYQERDYQEAKLVCPKFGIHWNIDGKKVLDVGSGLGGKAAYYADTGAHNVTAIDLRPYSAQAALAWAHRKQQRSIINPIVGNAATMPFYNDSFDVVVSINVFEHIELLHHTLNECKRVLRPDGLIFLYFPPFYSPWGAHLEGWIDFPWPHLFFSDQVLIEAAHRIEKQREKNTDYIPPAQVNWKHIERLPELNRVTVRRFLDLIRTLDLVIVESRMLPFAWHYLVDRGSLAQVVLAFLMRLSSLPLLREVITTKMVFVLKKI
jgi:SAM-dependent methyltransferase